MDHLLHGFEEGVPGLHPRAKFHRCGLKNVGLLPQNRQNWYFCIISPYAIFFTKFGLGKGVPGPHPHAKFYRCGFKNVRLQPTKL